MSVFRIKIALSLLILIGLMAPVFAQTAPDPVSAAPRAASFLADAPSATASGFSGLASAPEIVSPPVAVAPTTAAPAILGAPVSVTPLPNVSAESIGAQNADGLGAGMWKGTSRAVAEHLMAMAAVTTSPVLNDLARRLLTTSAVPPEGNEDSPSKLTSLRVEKLVDFGDTPEAWALASHADAALIDDATFHLAAENELAEDSESLCSRLPNDAQARSGMDWQKALIVCQLRSKDTKAAQVALDVMRAQPKRDDMFLQVADKNILSDGKSLPHQLTPLNAPMLALLRLTNLPLPGELYGHPDFALVPALLHAPAKEDVAQLGLAERAAQRGIITNKTLGDLYKTVAFTPDELASPLTASESGSRLRALMLQAASAEKDAARRISYAVKFMQSAPPELLNTCGPLLAAMVGVLKSDATSHENALTLAHIYMLANQGDAALEWLKVARNATANPDDLQSLWPQFTLSGLEADSDYAADLDQWLNGVLKQADPQADIRNARDHAAAVLLLLSADGFIVPDTAWAKVLAPSAPGKRVSFPALLFERLQAASTDNRHGESILLAIDAAGDGEIPPPVAVAITRALRLIGLKSEAAIFARQTVALLDKTN